MAFNFQNFIFGQLPIYYKVKDTHKDITDRGLLERYLEIFGLELDNQVIPQMESYLDIVDPLTTPDKFLTTLGYTLGSPPDLLGNPAAYAKLLAYIIQVYKIKGTARALELLFSLLGFNISVIEYAPSQTVYLDSGNILDNGGTLDSGCPGCSGYEVIVNSLLTPGSSICLPASFGVITPSILPTFIKIIEFNQPINADFLGLINGGLVCEEVTPCMDNVITLILLDPQTLDDAFLFDSGQAYDSGTIVSTTVITQLC